MSHIEAKSQKRKSTNPNGPNQRKRLASVKSKKVLESEETNKEIQGKTNLSDLQLLANVANDPNRDDLEEEELENTTQGRETLDGQVLRQVEESGEKEETLDLNESNESKSGREEEDANERSMIQTEEDLNENVETILSNVFALPEKDKYEFLASFFLKLPLSLKLELAEKVNFK